MKSLKRKEKQKIQRIWLKGSSTIEAALIMPLILTVLFLIIYLTLFLYGKTQLTRSAYVAVLRASQAEMETAQKRAAIAKKEFETLQDESYLNGIDVTKKIRSSGDMVIILVEYGQNINSAVLIEKGMSQRAFTGSMEYKAKTKHPASFIWNYRKVEEGISGNRDNKEKQSKKAQSITGQKEQMNYGDGIQTGSE